MPLFNNQEIYLGTGDQVAAEPDPTFHDINITFDGLTDVNDASSIEHLYLSEGDAAGNWWEGVFFRTNNEYFPTGPNIAMFHSNPAEDWFYVDAGTQDGSGSTLNVAFDARKLNRSAVWFLKVYHGSGFTPAQNNDANGLTEIFSDEIVFSQTTQTETYAVPIGSVPVGDSIYVRWEVDESRSTGHAGIDNIKIEAV